MTQPKVKSIKVLEGMLHKLTSDSYQENRAALTAAIEALRDRSNDDAADLMMEAKGHDRSRNAGAVYLQLWFDGPASGWIAYVDHGSTCCGATPQEALRALIERAKR